MCFHLGDFQAQINSTMNKFNNEEDLISFLKEKAESNLVAEMCSLIGVDNDGNYIYKMMKNRSKNPEAYFVIDAYEFLSFMKDKKMTFVFHTHLFSNEEPSEMDKKSSENCCLAYLI